jgi:hypothetical protein
VPPEHPPASAEAERASERALDRAEGPSAGEIGARSAGQRRVPARLVEATPAPLGYWLLASPLLIFLAWTWLDIFQHYSSLPWRGLDVVVAGLLLAFLLVLPLGVVAHWLVSLWPRGFQNAGWDVEPLEPVRDAEKYTVRYRAVEKRRARSTWSRLWLRAAQGWVYLEIVAILIGGLLLIPLFLSAMDFGFGR